MINFRQRGWGGERETSICCFTYLHIHWLLLVCALTGDQTCNLGVSRWRSNQLSYTARALIFNVKSCGRNKFFFIVIKPSKEMQSMTHAEGENYLQRPAQDSGHLDDQDLSLMQGSVNFNAVSSEGQKLTDIVSVRLFLIWWNPLLILSNISLKRQH